jgi:hypothetical protein
LPLLTKLTFATNLDQVDLQKNLGQYLVAVSKVDQFELYINLVNLQQPLIVSAWL